MSLISDIRKTISYAGRNGLKETVYAAAERIRDRAGNSYTYEAPALAELQRQRDSMVSGNESDLPLISILVPLYNPVPQFLAEMIESVLAQTYTNYELVIADGTTGLDDDNEAQRIINSYHSEKIIYRQLGRNGGISANTNAAADLARGDYVGLLDYDDLLTPDAVYEVTKMITGRDKKPEIIYSDEDKCDEKAKQFFEPNIKPDFNVDYFLSNNYICHFLVMKTELFKALRLRSEFDGAQDYDILLRAPWSGIAHISKVLYHWRTHHLSTAANPDSKNYAYDAGKRALEDYLRYSRIDAKVTDSRHRGFFKIEYKPDIFACRPIVGVVGGKIVDKKHRITGGMMDRDGKVIYKGCHEMESGAMHRADTIQDVTAVDVRCMQIRDTLRPLYQQVFNASYETHIMRPGDDTKLLSVEFCRRAAELGFLVVYDPDMVKYEK